MYYFVMSRGISIDDILEFYYEKHYWLHIKQFGSVKILLVLVFLLYNAASPCHSVVECLPLSKRPQVQTPGCPSIHIIHLSLYQYDPNVVNVRCSTI